MSLPDAAPLDPRDSIQAPVPVPLPPQGGGADDGGPAAAGSAVFVSPTYDRALSPALQALVPDAVGYAAHEHAPNTRQGYASAWRVFARWCTAHQRPALPVAIPDLVLCVTSWANAGASVRTLSHRLAAIVDRHKRAGHPLDLAHHARFQTFWKGVRRANGRPKVRKAPIRVDTLRALVATQPDTLLGVRNRALLLVGFTSLWRRSELSALCWDGVRRATFSEATLLVLPGATKTDQEAEGTATPIFPTATPATCPVRALDAWRQALVAAGASVDPATPVFRPVTRHGHVLPRALMGESIADVVQRAVAQAKRAREATARALETDPAATVAARRLAWTTVEAMHQFDAGRIDAWETYQRAHAAVREERIAARRAARLARQRLRRAGRHAEADALQPVLPPWPKRPSTRSTVGGHSLRAGGITAAVVANKPVPLIRQLSRHTSDAFYDYVRDVEQQRTNVMADLGL